MSQACSKGFISKDTAGESKRLIPSVSRYSFTALVRLGDAVHDQGIVNRGSVTAERYITTILDQYVVPFAPFIVPSLIFKNDNVRPHCVRIVNEYLEEVGIVSMN